MSGADNQFVFNLFDYTICVSASDKSTAGSLLSVYDRTPRQTDSNMHTSTQAKSSPVLKDYCVFMGGKVRDGLFKMSKKCYLRVSLPKVKRKVFLSLLCC